MVNHQQLLQQALGGANLGPQTAGQSRGPIMRNPTPDWLRPENDSVLDSLPEKAVKSLLRILGADDPQSQVLALMAPLTPKIKGSMTLFRGVRQAGDAHLRGRQGGKLVSAAMDQVGEKGTFFSRNPGIAKEYLKDIDGAMSPDGGIWVTKANKKDAPPHWMSRMWGESSHIVDVDKQRGKLRYIPTQDAWRSPHAEDAIKRRAAKELSGSADDTRRALAERNQAALQRVLGGKSK